MPAPTRLLLLVLLCAACYARKAEPGAAPISGNGLPIPDGGMSGALPGDASPPDAAAGDSARLDSSPDRALPAQVTAYRRYLDEQWKAWSARWISCFNSAPEALSPGRSPLYDDSPDQHAYSLEHGLVVLDQAGARACLDALRTLPCEALVTESYRQTCRRALVGKVASGAFCDSNEDCQSATDECQMKEPHGCSTRCGPAPAPAAIDESCDGRACVAGAFCATATPPAS